MTLSHSTTRLRSVFFVALFGVFLFASPQAKGQDFNYTLQVNTTNWSELSSQTLCNSVNQPWQSSYRIATGFSFPFNGGSYDSVTIETNGYLVFDENRNQAFIAYSLFGSKIDTSGNYSVLGYELTGDTGNRILKIQYKNVGVNNYTLERLSYQIWLYENGNIDLITGDNNFQPDPNDTLAVPDTSQRIYIGLLNMNKQGTVSGYYAGLTSMGPGGQPVNDMTPEPLYFNSVPYEGTRFRFIPASSN